MSRVWVLTFPALESWKACLEKFLEMLISRRVRSPVLDDIRRWLLVDTD